ncbi:hypothetical protein DX130_05250 [Paenibacillus paeoniae]|uniref:ATP-binding protein n=2 Tax=Paenibacillus paeoniae TaxID=2292705 RepID=A0A371PJR2_9BACL|nr:hypothetical protein DX130_05250 [Paenibacillus paeoniae]
MILSCDDLMLSIFDEQLGDKHQLIHQKAVAYLFNQAVELVSIDVNVVLDFGFWSKTERREAQKYFSDRGIVAELHYMNAPDVQIKQQLQMRKLEIKRGDSKAYYIEDEMQNYLDSKFEEPTDDEGSAWVNFVRVF